jgi:hypothetical protein
VGSLDGMVEEIRIIVDAQSSSNHRSYSLK